MSQRLRAAAPFVVLLVLVTTGVIVWIFSDMKFKSDCASKGGTVVTTSTLNPFVTNGVTKEIKTNCRKLATDK